MGKKKDPKDKMVFLGITIDQTLSVRLNQYVKDHNTTASWAVRQALKSFLPMKY